MRRFNLYEVDPVDQLAGPSIQDMVTLDSPALSLLLDFQAHEALVAGSDDRACDLEQSMLRTHVHLRLVVDKNNQFLGLVSLDDINAQEIMKKVAKGFLRDNLLATDFMHPKESLRALDYHELKQASVRDVVQMLRKNEHQYYLVVDRRAHRIRGVISAADIASRLGLDISVNKSASFINVYAALHPEPLQH